MSVSKLMFHNEMENLNFINYLSPKILSSSKSYILPLASAAFNSTKEEKEKGNISVGNKTLRKPFLSFNLSLMHGNITTFLSLD